MVNKIKTLYMLETACVYHSYCLHKRRTLKAAKVPIGFASIKVASFNQHPVMEKMVNLLLEWVDRYPKRGVLLSYT